MRFILSRKVLWTGLTFYSVLIILTEKGSCEYTSKRPSFNIFTQILPPPRSSLIQNFCLKPVVFYFLCLGEEFPEKGDNNSPGNTVPNTPNEVNSSCCWL